MNEKTHINSEPEMGNTGTLQVTGIKGHCKRGYVKPCTGLGTKNSAAVPRFNFFNTFSILNTHFRFCKSCGIMIEINNVLVATYRQKQTGFNSKWP